MRKRCLDAIHALAREDRNVLFIGSDLGVGVLDALRRERPAQFFMEGASEQHLVGMAAGLALSGKTPFVCTIASFLTRRCFEQNALDLGLHRARVRLVGLGGGLVYGPQGATHLAIDDLALMRSIPGMCVVAPADADEMERAVRATPAWGGPVYLRVAKGGEPAVSGDGRGFELGRAVLHRPAGDALIATTGVTLSRALEAADRLAAEGVACGVLHFHTLKPFDSESLRRASEGVRAVVTAEEHLASGGLGTAVAEALAEQPGRPPLRRLGLPDAFPTSYASQDALLEAYGLHAEGLALAVKSALRP